MTVVKRHDFHDAASAASSGETWECVYLLTKAILVDATAFTGKLTIQGSFDGQTWVNALYMAQGQTDAKPSIDPISLVGYTGLKAYVTSELWPFMRIPISDYVAGSVTVKAYGHEIATPIGPYKQEIYGEVKGAVDPATHTIACGELIGVTTATQLPIVDCKMVRFKAQMTNTGYVYLGGIGVTKRDGATDTTTGFELAAGDDTGWIPVSNVSVFYRICDGATDCLTYLALT